MLDIYTKALSANLVQQDVEQIIPLALARAGYEVRRIESGTAGTSSLCCIRAGVTDRLNCGLDEDTPGVLVQSLEDGINMVRKGEHCYDRSSHPDLTCCTAASTNGDARLRLEKYLAEFVSSP